MPKSAEIKTLIVLIVFTFMTVIVYSMGSFNTTLDLLDPEEGFMIIPIQNQGAAIRKIHSKTHRLELICHIEDPYSERFCGFTVMLSNDMRHGRDFSHFQKIRFQATYNTPQVEKGMRIYLRNFNPDYSRLNDPVTIKFNSFLLPPPDGRPLTIPMNLLQVETWWIAKLNMNLEHAKVEVNNVSMVEVLSNTISSAGDYHMAVDQLTFQGELISGFNLAKILLAIWFVTAIVLLNSNRLKLQKAIISDPMTGALNRRGLLHYFEQMKSSGDYKVTTAFYINLDNFKQINDSLGHQTGDYILKCISQRIQALLTEYEPDLLTRPAFGRFSSDEYLIIFHHLNQEQVCWMDNRLHQTINEPMRYEQMDLQVYASIGIAATNKPDTFDELFAKTDTAMRIAKQSGKNQSRMFDSEVYAIRQERIKLAADLRQAINQEAFELFYMPIFASDTLKITAVEALIRCNYAPIKHIGPEIFIPVAEEYDLIQSIDLWVIETIFKQLQSNRQLNQFSNLKFSINISAKELYNVNFPNILAEWIVRYDVDPTMVELEITETCLVEVGDSVINNINRLKTLGFSIALDDFGTGYMAFNQLNLFPVDTIKIDKSFVTSFDPAKQHRSVAIEAVLLLAESFNLRTVAEGVETQEQYLYLKKQKCQFFQGYFKSPPLDWQTLCQRWDQLEGACPPENRVLGSPV
ncbi:putative bifunctional diguanylate cyclase/phosphodiesterase [Gynuella sunshinyii]|uniref:EAL domain n=1 Tax=Gynuella sunshinyii YC6258 TaxID=1445510 RepID=A0A0C5VFJ1_9GAMM|nr:bifunctional diguanylate cyclase/phosphodiesterase [Gynuella sunshinyii]AJQ93312.1 EAL domain [Gynuella sunshinyii YC6258]